MFDIANMSAKAVQISLDEELLRKIDSDPEALSLGRSAFIRSAVMLYLRARERQTIDQQIVGSYEGYAEDLLAEIEDFIGEQAWPEP